jgi:hypothetical protein
MTKEKWSTILGNILDNFDVLEHEKEFIEEDGGIDLEYIVFKSPMGKIRLEFVEKPVVVDKKTNYSKRIGSETAVEYVYSDSEKTSRLLAYKWDDSSDDWVEINENSFQ